MVFVLSLLSEILGGNHHNILPSRLSWGIVLQLTLGE